MTDPKQLAARIDDLEERIAHQDKAIDDLNETITGQWKLIDKLKRELSRLTDQMREIEGALDGKPSPQDPPPPHY